MSLMPDVGEAQMNLKAPEHQGFTEWLERDRQIDRDRDTSNHASRSNVLGFRHDGHCCAQECRARGGSWGLMAKTERLPGGGRIAVIDLQKRTGFHGWKMGKG